MNSLGLNLILKMGCICARESVTVNNKRYNVRGHLGEGGFSTVDLIEDVHAHKLYALKRITCHSPEDQKTAMAEVEFYRMVQHPNVISCIDSSLVGKPDLISNATSEVLIVLPYYQRGTLSSELERRSKRQDPFEQVLLLKMFRHICEGVRAFHEAKPYPLAHRDLKTANVLLADDYTPVLMDLGSTATARIDIKGPSEALKLQDWAAERCSMPYKAPELFQVESYCNIDERTDIWSLGCVLYAMCFYKSPFDLVYERGDSVALAVASVNINIPENSTYSEGVHDLIYLMLKTNPLERPFIQTVIEKTLDLLVQAENRV